MKAKLVILVSFIILTSHFFSLPAFAESRNPSLDETFTVRLGPFWADLDATIKAQGYDVNMDENIDAGDVNFATYGLWRITERFRLEVGYSGFEKENTESLANDIEINSITIPAGSSLYSTFETEVIRMALGFAFFRGDSYEVGMDLGVNYTTLKQSLIGSVPGIGHSEVTAIDVSAPLPTIGLFFNYAFTEKWYLTTRAGMFSLVEVGDYDGTVYDLYGAIEFRPWQHFGLGLAYTYTSADLTITDNNSQYDIEYDYSGPLLYLVMGF